MNLIDMPEQRINDPRGAEEPCSDGRCATCDAPLRSDEMLRCEECGPKVRHCSTHSVNQGDKIYLCVAHSTYQPPEAWRKSEPVERAAHAFSCSSYFGNATKILVAERMSDDDIAAGARLARDEQHLRERFRSIHGDTRFGAWPPDVQARLRAELSELRNKPVRVVDQEHPLRDGELSELMKSSIEQAKERRIA